MKIIKEETNQSDINMLLKCAIQREGVRIWEFENLKIREFENWGIGRFGDLGIGGLGDL